MRAGALTGAAGTILILAGCNTVTRGVEEAVTITASPASARIRTSLGHECARSPCIVRVDRRTAFTATAEAPGYQPGSVTVTTQVSGQAAPGVVGNVILPGGTAGLVLDAATGAMLDHTPNPAHIALVPLGRARAR